MSLRLYFFFFLSFPLVLHARSLYENNQIDYHGSKAENEITRLQKRLDQGLTLKHDEKHGYLKSLLNALDVPVSSQVLVFSKTSLHRNLISTGNPRALYFNKDVYIGWIDGAKILEIAVADQNLGAVFYTFPQQEIERLRFLREDSCLNCHASGRTMYEPGFVVRSVFPEETGEIIFSAGTDDIDHSTPVEDRWGGYFVTAQQFIGTHRGNGLAVEKGGRYTVSSKKAHGLSDLSSFFDPNKFLTDTSDIQSLLILDHQAKMHNLLTVGKFRTMLALNHENAINQAFGESGRRNDTKIVLDDATEKILDYLLFVDEVNLNGLSIVGDQTFLQDYAQTIPRSKSGASLGDFSFDKRISRYPCSWMIYSDSFQGLPEELKQVVLKRLVHILTKNPLAQKYGHLQKTRDTIHLLLLETLPSYAKVFDEGQDE